MCYLTYNGEIAFAKLFKIIYQAASPNNFAVKLLIKGLSK